MTVIAVVVSDIAESNNSHKILFMKVEETLGFSFGLAFYQTTLFVFVKGKPLRDYIFSCCTDSFVLLSVL